MFAFTQKCSILEAVREFASWGFAEPKQADESSIDEFKQIAGKGDTCYLAAEFRIIGVDKVFFAARDPQGRWEIGEMDQGMTRHNEITEKFSD